jgi:hypothetical protein
MQSTVKRAATDVTLRGLPDAEALAKKYDVDSPRRETAIKAETEALFLQQVEFAQKQQAMVQKLEGKNMEVERLCVLLEAMEPVPGMDAAKYKRLIENPDNSDVDFRDSKIVALAKKSRKLQLSLNKERSITEAQASTIEELRNVNDKLRKEIDVLAVMASSSGASASRTIRAPQFAAGGSPDRKGGPAQSLDPAELETANTQLRKELSAANKTAEELRRKIERSAEEVKNLSQALAREVGDGVTLEQAVDGGWRGRAQQIIMLKSKIRRLESAAGMNSTTGTVQTFGTMSTRREGVDARAESGLAEMTSERKVAVDALVEERARLMEECQRQEAKAQGQKARVRKLEEEAATHRQQLKIVLDKSETDDQLISALRREVQRLQSGSVAQSKNNEIKNEVAIRQAGVLATDAANAEISRLKRTIAQQSAQLATQDQRLRELQPRRGF